MGFLSAFVENMFFQTDAQRYWQPEHYGLTGIPFGECQVIFRRFCS